MVRTTVENMKPTMGLLFSEEEMCPRINAVREEVYNAFSIIADKIANAIVEANNDYLAFAENHSIARRQNNFVTTNLHGLIIEKMSNVPDVELKHMDGSGNVLLSYGKYQVWTKKLDEAGMPNINYTKSSVKRISQIVDGNDVAPMLILGYTLDELQRVSSIKLQYMQGTKHLWAPIDIVEMMTTGTTTTIESQAEDVVSVKVKPGKNRNVEAI